MMKYDDEREEKAPLVSKEPIDYPVGTKAMKGGNDYPMKSKKHPEEEIGLDGRRAKDVNYYGFNHIGLFFQYFFVGIVLACSRSLGYEFFRNYLGQSGDFFNVCMATISLPWGFKFFYGAMNDCFPILRYRRKPYMVIGWVGCVVTCLLLVFLPMPESRYAPPWESGVKNDSCSLKGHKHFRSGTTTDQYEDYAYKYMCLFFVLNVFLLMADVAMDGLMVQYSRREPEETRGRAQSMIYIFRRFGILFASIVKAFGLNWWPYGGPWCHGFSVKYLFILSGGVSALAIPISIFMTTEDQVKVSKSVFEIMSLSWAMMKRKVVQRIILFQMIAGILLSLASPANSMIQSYWLDVSPLAKNIGGKGGGMLALNLGNWVFTKYLINKNWRVTFGSSCVFIVSITVATTAIIVFDVWRSQYLYLTDEIMVDFVEGMNFLAISLAFVEISEDHTEGISFAMMVSFSNLCGNFGPILSNILCAPFKVSSPDRYLKVNDTPKDRQIIFAQYGMIYGLQFCIIFALFLLPQSKQKCRELKEKMGSSTFYGALLSVVFSVFFAFNIVNDFYLYKFYKS